MFLNKLTTWPLASEVNGGQKWMFKVQKWLCTGCTNLFETWYVKSVTDSNLSQTLTSKSLQLESMKPGDSWYRSQWHPMICSSCNLYILKIYSWLKWSDLSSWLVTVSKLFDKNHYQLPLACWTLPIISFGSGKDSSIYHKELSLTTICNAYG